MLSRLVIQLQGKPNNTYYRYLGSSMQGVLMEFLDMGYASAMHANQLHPYSQYVESRRSDGSVRWVICALNQEADEQIVRRIKDQIGNEIYIDHHDEYLKVCGLTEERISYKELTESYFFGNHERTIRICFLTPSSFKQNGQYQIFPSVRLIFQSLMNRFDVCAPDQRIGSDDLLQHFEDHAQIVRYQLKSSTFYAEGVRIPGFTGQVTINISGPGQMVNLAWLLAAFGEYSGVGIKTAMGMGGMVKGVRNDGQKK